MIKHKFSCPQTLHLPTDGDHGVKAGHGDPCYTVHLCRVTGPGRSFSKDLDPKTSGKICLVKIWYLVLWAKSVEIWAPKPAETSV
jgi:hypothetical protein